MQLTDEEDVVGGALPCENDDDRKSQDLLTRASIISAAQTFGATPPRSVKRLSLMPKHRKLVDPVTPLKSIKADKENLSDAKSAKKNIILMKCQPSGMVVTSYSPSAAVIQKNTPKSFACFIESNCNTPKSDYGTPRSILSELNQEADDDIGTLEVTPKKTPLSSIRSMHLIDFTTPDVYNTPKGGQRAITRTPLLKSALKNSTVKTASKAIGRNLEMTTSGSNKKPLFSSSASPKTTGSQITPRRIDNKTPVRPGTVPNKLDTSSISRSVPRKSVSRLSFCATETPKPLTRRRTLTVASAKSAPRPSKATPILKRKSLFISKPLETPKSIFSNSRTTRNTPGTPGLNRHSCVKTPTSVQKNLPPVKTPSTGKKTVDILERSKTFILDSPTVLRANKSTVGEDADTGKEHFDSDVVACSLMSESVAVVAEEQNVSSSTRETRRSSSLVPSDSSSGNQQIVANDNNLELELPEQSGEQLGLNVSTKSSNKSLCKLNDTFDKEFDSEDDGKDEVVNEYSEAANFKTGESARKSSRRSIKCSEPGNDDSVQIVTPQTTQVDPINEHSESVLNATFDKDCELEEEKPGDETTEEIAVVESNQSQLNRRSGRYSKSRQSTSGGHKSIALMQDLCDDTLDLNTSLNALSKSEILSISILSHDEGNEVVHVRETQSAQEEIDKSNEQSMSFEKSPSQANTANEGNDEVVCSDRHKTPIKESRESQKLSTSVKSNISIVYVDDQSRDISARSTNILSESDILSVTVGSSEEANESAQSEKRRKSTRRSRSILPHANDSSNAVSPENNSKQVNDIKPVHKTYSHSPRLGGVRELLKTPKPAKETNLTGVKELVNTPKTITGLDNVVGVKEIFNTPYRDELTDFLGVKELVCTPKTGPGLTDPKGMKELFNTPVRDDLSDLRGVKELLNTPKETKGFDDVKGMKEMFNTPARDDLCDVRGIKELVNTPKPMIGLSDLKGIKELFNTPKSKPGLDDLKGMKEMFNTPKPSAGLVDPKGMKELFNTPARNELSDIRGVKELLKTPLTSTPDLKGVHELMRTPHVPNYDDTDGLSDIFKTPAARSLMVLSTPNSIAVERSNLSGHLLKTPKELNVLEGIEEVGEIFESPVSNLISSKSLLDENEDLSPEESFDRLTGSKPSNRRTYARTSVTLRVLPIPVAEKSPSDKPQTDIEEWLDGVSNAESIANREDQARIDSPYPKRITKPLAASSCIKPSMHGSTRKSNNQEKSVNLNDISGFEELDDSISEISGVFLDSEDCNNPSETPCKVTASNDELVQTGSKSVQFVDICSPRRRSLKRGPQIDKLRNRISTPHGKKLVNKSIKTTLNSSSLQFIDESTAADESDADNSVANTSRYKIRKSIVGDDISLELIDSNNDSSLVLDKTTDKLQLAKDSGFLRKIRSTESSSVISVADEEETTRDLEFRENVVNATDQSKLGKSLRSNAQQTLEFVDANELSVVSMNTAKMSNTNAFKSILSATSDSVDCIDEDETEKTIDVSSRATSVYSVSMQESVSYMEEEEKLLEQYDKELSQGKETIDQQSIEVVYLSEKHVYSYVGQLKPTMTPAKDALNISEKRSTRKSHQRANETNYKSFEESMANASSLDKSIKEDHTSPGNKTLIAQEFSNFSENPAIGTLLANKAQTPNTSKKVEGNRNRRKTLGSSANTTMPILDLEAEKLKSEFCNFEANPKSRTVRGLSQLPSEMTRMTVSRRTMGQLPLNPGFDLEAELERRNMSIEFENFKDDGKVSSLRGRSLSPLKKPKTSVASGNRMTIGQKRTDDESFDYEYELERRNRSLELANIESEPSTSRRGRRGRSEVGVNSERSSKSSERRLTTGQISSNTFDHEIELERRNMSLEFENFKSDEIIDLQARRRTVHVKATRTSIEKDRRTVGHQPLNEQFDIEKEKERYIVEKEFEHFDAKSRPMRKRGLSQVPIYDVEKISNVKKNRRTMGQEPLTEEFDVETEKERHILEKEFENFDAETRKLRIRGRSQSPVKDKDTDKIKKGRRTAGYQPLSEEFNAELEKERYVLEKEFENFEPESRRMRVRIKSQSPVYDKTADPADKMKRKTMGDHTDQVFNVTEEKERVAQMQLDEEELLETPHPVEEKPVLLEKSPEKQEMEKKPSTRVRNFVVGVESVSTPSPQRVRGRPGRRGQAKPVPVENIVVDSDTESVPEIKQSETEQNAKTVRSQRKPKKEEIVEVGVIDNKSESQIDTGELQTAKVDAVSETETEVLPSRRKGGRKPAEVSRDDEETNPKKTSNVSLRRGARNRLNSNAEKENTPAEVAVETKAEDVETAGRSTRRGRKAPNQQAKQTNDDGDSIENPTDSNESNENQQQSVKTKCGGCRGVNQQTEVVSDQVQENMENYSVETTTESVVEFKVSDAETEADENGRHVRFGENKYFEISRIDLADIDTKGKRPTKKRQTKTVKPKAEKTQTTEDEPVVEFKTPAKSRSRRGGKSAEISDDSAQSTEKITTADKTQTTDDEPVVEFKTPAKSRSRRGAKSVQNSDDTVQDSVSVKVTTARTGSRSRRGATKTEPANDQTNGENEVLSIEDEQTQNIEKNSEDDRSNDEKKPTTSSRSRRAAAKSVTDDESIAEKKPTGRSRRGAAKLVETSENLVEKKPRNRRGRAKTTDTNVDSNIEQDPPTNQTDSDSSETPVKLVVNSRTGRGTRANLIVEPTNDESTTPVTKPTRGRGRTNATKSVDKITLNGTVESAVTQIIDNEKENLTEEKTPAKRTRRLASNAITESEIVSSATKLKPRTTRRKQVAEENTNDSSSISKSTTPNQIVELQPDNETKAEDQSKPHVEPTNDESTTPVTKPTRGRGRTHATKSVEKITLNGTVESAVTQIIDNEKENLTDEKTPAKRTRRLASNAITESEIVSSATKLKSRTTRQKQIPEENTNDSSSISKSTTPTQIVELQPDNATKAEDHSKPHVLDGENAIVIPSKAKRTRKAPVDEEGSASSKTKDTANEPQTKRLRKPLNENVTAEEPSSDNKRTNKRRVDTVEVVQEEQVKKTRSRRKLL